MWNAVSGIGDDEIRNSCPAGDIDCLVIAHGVGEIEHMRFSGEGQCWNDPTTCQSIEMDEVEWWWPFPDHPDIELSH